jgi:hypothetical protein
MSDETKVQESANADDNSVSQPIAKPHVVCSQSPEIYDAEKICIKELKIDYTNGRVWIQIDNVGVGYDKENFIALIEQSESFQFALNLKKELDALGE